MWLTANVQLIAPIISLAVDTKLFVKFIFRGPLLLFTAVCVCTASTLLAAGHPTSGNVLRLYRLPQRFRFESEAFALGETAFYLLLISLTRYMLKRYFRRKVVPS